MLEERENSNLISPPLLYHIDEASSTEDLEFKVQRLMDEITEKDAIINANQAVVEELMMLKYELSELKT